MAKKGVIHQGSGRPRTFIGVIQGVTRDLQAQRQAREEQRREERLCESLRQTDITPRPLSGLSGGTAVPPHTDDLFAPLHDERDSITQGRHSSQGKYDSNPYPKPYRAPSPPPRYPSSNARSAALPQRSATTRETTTTTRRSGRDALPYSARRAPRDRASSSSRLSSVLENQLPHPRDLEVRAISPGRTPRQVQLGQRTGVRDRTRGGSSSRRDRRVPPPAELRAEYPPLYTRDSRSGRDRYYRRER